MAGLESFPNDRDMDEFLSRNRIDKGLCRDSVDEIPPVYRTS